MSLKYIGEILPALFSGATMTLSIFFWTIILATPLEILVSLGEMSKIKPIKWLVNFYVWIMRGTPLLLQLIFVFYGLPIIHIVFPRYDEPTSALDPNLRKEVEKMILGLKKSGLTQLISTHDLQFAENVADQMLKVQPLSEGQPMKKWIIAIIGILALTLTGCAKSNNPDSWQTIEKNKQVVIGLDDSFVPMGFEKKNGQLTGYDIDLARAVFKEYGIKVSFQTIDWSMNVTELRNGTIDLIWNGYSITPERKKKVAFSRPYLRNRQVLVVKKNSGIDSFAQMKKYELGMQTGSTAEQWYETKQNVLHVKKTILYDTISNSLLDLNSGRIQGILLDEVYADYYIAHMVKSSEYKVIQNDRVPFDEFAVGMRKGDKTLQKKAQRRIGQIAEEWQIASN